eukprot:scaffold785_cov301-Chaetoceros_neogracile.AAC.5
MIGDGRRRREDGLRLLVTLFRDERWKMEASPLRYKQSFVQEMKSVAAVSKKLKVGLSSLIFYAICVQKVCKMSRRGEDGNSTYDMKKKQVKITDPRSKYYETPPTYNDVTLSPLRKHESSNIEQQPKQTKTQCKSTYK